jgi:hypothetical protein
VLMKFFYGTLDALMHVIYIVKLIKEKNKINYYGGRTMYPFVEDS